MIRVTLSLLLMTTLSLGAAAAQARVLGSVRFAGTTGATRETAHIELNADTNPPSFTGDHPLFDGTLFTAGYAGSEVVATASSDPDFDHVVAMLTNGTNDTICLNLSASPGETWVCDYEHRAFGLEGNDFQGETIDRIVMAIDELSFTQVDLTYDVTIRIESSSVPAAASSWGMLKARAEDPGTD